MKKNQRWLAIGTMALLSACGGGGGGGGTPTPSPNPPTPPAPSNGWLTFSPASVDLSFYELDTPTFAITATSSKTIEGTIQVGVIDATGVLDPTGTTIAADTPYSYTARLRIARGLRAGER